MAGLTRRGWLGRVVAVVTGAVVAPKVIEAAVKVGPTPLVPVRPDVWRAAEGTWASLERATFPYWRAQAPLRGTPLLVSSAQVRALYDECRTEGSGTMRYKCKGGGKKGGRR